jgi:undecaprenyl-diphosphatase
VVATVPVGLTGLILEHTFRTLFAKPLAAAIFLLINGFILLAGERLRRRAETRVGIDPTSPSGDLPASGGSVGRLVAASSTGVVIAERRTVDTLSYREAVIIGAFQTLALLAGISRSGVTMVGGLLRGLDHEDAAKFAFLLATPVIFAAGVLKLPSLAGSAGAHIHGQVIVGFVVAGLSAYAAIRFLTATSAPAPSPRSPSTASPPEPSASPGSPDGPRP